MNNINLIIFIFYSYIYCSLPKSGKFIIKKYSDDKYENVVSVTLNEPSSVCWSTNFDNGIKPINFNSQTKKLSIKAFNVNSCYGTLYDKKEIDCDDSQQNYTIDNNYVYFKCSYVPYPSKANFTLNIYNDDKCYTQKGIVLIKGNSNCWKINDNLSMNPLDFNIDNLEDLNVNVYSNGDCTQSFIEKQFECDGKCQNINNNYFRCYYISGNFLKFSLIYKILIFCYLFF